MWRRLLTLIFAVLLVAGLTACGGEPDVGEPDGEEDPAAGTEPDDDPDPVTLTIWHTYNPDADEYAVFVNEVIPLFESQYTHITIDEVNQPYDGLHDALVTAVAGGNAPDLMRMDIIWVPEFAALGALEAVDGHDGFAELRQVLYPGPMETNHYAGSYYGLPLNTNTQVMIYRRDALEAAGLDSPPATVEDFEEFLAATSGGGNHGHALSSSFPWNLFPWFWTLGGRVTSDDYTQASGHLNSPESVAAVEKINEWLEAGYLARTMIGGEPGTWDGYTDGQYASIIDGPWTFAILGGDHGDQMAGATVPEGPGGSVSVVGGENIVMFNQTDHKEAAWLFMRFMVSQEVQETMARTGLLPVNPDASRVAVEDVDYHGFYVEQLATAQPRTPVPTWARIDDILGNAFESVFRGVTDAQSALDDAAAQIDALLTE
jgi:multiple sugar transport system substrate-binding protein